MNHSRTRSRTAVAYAIAIMLTLVPGSSASAQGCACIDAFIGDTIAEADGVFVGTVADQSVEAGSPTTYEVETWIKGDVAAERVAVESGECATPVPEVGDAVAVALTVNSAGRVVETCSLPSASSVVAFAEPDQSGTAPAVWFATSATAPPLLLDANGRIVASDPDTDNRRIEAAAACPDGTVAHLQDQEVTIVDAGFAEVERFPFRRVTDELFCPEPGVVLAVAGPPAEKRVYDVGSRSALTSPLAFGGPVDAVGDLVAGGMQGSGDANATVRVVSRSSGLERTLIDPALIVGARPVSITSARLSPSADRVAFTITSGPEENQQAAVMVADTAGGSILALADIDATSDVAWLSGERLLVQTATGRSTVHDAGTLSVERAVDARWIQHLDGDQVSGFEDIGSGGPERASTLVRLDLPDGTPTVISELPFEIEAIRLPEPVTPTTSGSAFVEPLSLPLPSERLDGLVATSTAEGTVFLPDEGPPTTPPPSADDEEEARDAASIAVPATGGDDAGILMWAVIAGAIAIGGVVLLLARPRARPH